MKVFLIVILSFFLLSNKANAHDMCNTASSVPHDECLIKEYNYLKDSIVKILDTFYEYQNINNKTKLDLEKNQNVWIGKANAACKENVDCYIDAMLTRRNQLQDYFTKMSRAQEPSSSTAKRFNF